MVPSAISKKAVLRALKILKVQLIGKWKNRESAFYFLAITIEEFQFSVVRIMRLTSLSFFPFFKTTPSKNNVIGSPQFRLVTVFIYHSQKQNLVLSYFPQDAGLEHPDFTLKFRLHFL